MPQIRYLTPEQCDDLLLGIVDCYGHKPDTEPCFRWRLAALLMLDSGLRVGEIVQLAWGNLIVSGQIVKLLDLPAEVTKTKQSRQIPFTDRLRDAINMYHSLYPLDCPPDKSSYVFRGNKDSSHITVREVQHVIKKIGLKYLKCRVTPHMLRHTFATRMMHQTSMKVVQDLLGHKLLSSTQIYLHPTIGDAIKAIKSLGV